MMSPIVVFLGDLIINSSGPADQ